MFFVRKSAFALSDVYAAMGKPGGGRNEVDPRFISMFSVYCMVFPSDDTINHIFHSILSGHTRDFNDDVKSVVPTILQMTLKLYKVNRFLKIAFKFEYIKYIDLSPPLSFLDNFSRTSTNA